MAERSVLVRLQANISNFKAQMRAAEQAAEDVAKKGKKSSEEASTALGRLTQSAQQHRAEWDQAGATLAAFGAVTVASLGATVKAAIDWESAWAGVTKTVDGTPAELQAVEDGLRGLAKTLPAAHGEIAAVAEAAGQLGVQTGSVVAFTSTMIDLGETTNLSADQAATALAQMMNVMQTAPEDVGRLGAALVALGNDGASTEADILNMASYITGAAKLIGASESDVLALANTMTSLGINAERGGGVMTRTMQDIYSAVQTGGDKLEGFARVAGVSGAEFAQAFEADPIRAIGMFTDGLAAAKDSGDNVVSILGDLGIKGTQDTAVLLQMAGAQGMVNENLDLGNQAWQENTALVEEAAKRYDTTAAKLEIARNGLNDAAIEIGENFLPVLASLAGSVADVANWFGDLPDPVQAAMGGIAGVAGVAALAGGAFLLLFPRVLDTVQAFRSLSTSNPGLASGLGKVGKAVGVVALAFTAWELATAGGQAATDNMTTSIIEGGQQLEELRAKAEDAADTGFWEHFRGNLLFRDIWDENFGSNVVENFENAQAAAGELWRSMTPLEQANQKQAEWTRTLAFRLREYGPAAEETRIAQERLAFWTGEAAGAQEELDVATEGAIVQLAQVAVAGQTGYESLTTYAAALGMSEDATTELRNTTDALGESLATFVDPLGAYTGLLDEKAAAEQEAAQATADATDSATDSWEDYASDVSVSIGEYMARLEEQLLAQQNWQTNMLILASRVSSGTITELANMGVEGAGLVAQLVNASDAELDRFDDITAARSAEATAAWGEQLFLAQPVLAQIAATAGEGVVSELVAQLQAGTTTVAAIAAQYGISLADGINPVLRAVGKPAVVITAEMRSNPYYANRREGGVIDYFAGGGLYEDHVAQIAPAGDWRVWAEEETGGEAYIPLSPAKRRRSMDIWRETGRRLNAPEVEYFAFGGVKDIPRPPSLAPSQPPVSSGAEATMQKGFDELRTWLAANQEPPQTSVGGSASGLLPIMAAARAYVSERYGVKNIGGFARRNIAGTKTLSKHALGKAIDIMTSNRTLGWAIANDMAFGEAHRRFNIENTIWQQSISSRGGPFKRMADRGSITQNHYDHVHADTFADGGLLGPLFGPGGLLNPHVRDTGGPLLPGFTFNGLGRPETVVPDHLVDARLLAATAPAPSGQVTADQLVTALTGLNLEGVLELRDDGYARMSSARFVRDTRKREHLAGV